MKPQATKYVDHRPLEWLMAIALSVLVGCFLAWLLIVVGDHVAAMLWSWR